MTTRIIEPPKFAPRPGISDGMSPDDLWAYACLVGYRYKLSEHDKLQSEEYARAAIQQAAGAVPEGWKLSDWSIAAIGRKHFGNPIPPEWYTAVREALAASPTPPASGGSSDHLAACAGDRVQVPLTEAEIATCAWGLFPDHKNLPPEVEALVRAVEATHGILAPRPDAPTGQIKELSSNGGREGV